jgi:hypothetical protein
MQAVGPCRGRVEGARGPLRRHRHRNRPAECERRGHCTGAKAGPSRREAPCGKENDALAHAFGRGVLCAPKLVRDAER